MADHPSPSIDAPRLADLIARHDWSATPLGPADAWPQSLKTSVDIMLGSGHAMMLAWGPKRTILYNDAYAPMMGDRHPAGLGKPLAEARPDVWKEIAPLVTQVFAGETVTFEDMPLTSTRHGFAEQTWWTFSYSPIRDEAGAVAGLLNVTVDTSAKVRADAALRESDARHRLLIESWAQAVWETDAAGVVVTDSPSWRAYTGQTLEEWLGHGWLDAIHPDDRAFAERHWREAMAARRRVNAEFRLRSPDGGWRWTNVLATPMLDAAGGIDKWLGLNIDIDDRKRVEAALRQSEEKYRNLFETMRQGYVENELIRDADGRAVDYRTMAVNPQFERLTGIPVNEAVGRTARELVGKLDPAWIETYDRVVRTGQPEQFEREEPAFGRWFEVQAYPLAGDRFAILYDDITERREVDGALHESEERLQTLVAELQHRVRNILTVVRSVFDRTVEAGGEIQDIAQHFQGRLDALARTQVIVTQTATGRVDLENLIRDELLSVGAGDNPALTISGPDVMLDAKTAESLGLAIHELTTNALKYGALRFQSAQLGISWTCNIGYGGKTRLDFTWAEQGVPMISVQPRRYGFGSELIEEALPYRLGAETRLEFMGGGLRCTISLPLTSGAGEMRGERAVSADLSGKNILVIEDEYFIASDLKRALIKAGANVVGPTGDLAKGRGLVANMVVDAAVLDVNLGDERSYEIADDLNALGIPFAFLTGYDGWALPERFRSVPLIGKPCPAAVVVDQLAALTGGAPAG